MRITPTPLAGAFVIDVEQIADERGFFARSWCAKEMAAHGLDGYLAQASVSFNATAGTLRGMHLQMPPHAETKVVRCTRGSVHDVILDLRHDSPTFKRWFAARLTAENHTALYVPAGFAHGFQTLESDTEILYQMAEVHVPGHARGVRWDDPAFGIQWPHAAVRTMSETDRNHPDFAR